MTEPNRPRIEWVSKSTDIAEAWGKAVWTYRSGPAMAEKKAAVPFYHFKDAFRVDEIIRAAYHAGRYDERQQLTERVRKAMEGGE